QQPLPRVAPAPDSGAELAAAMAEFDALYRARSASFDSAAPRPVTTAPSGPPASAPSVPASSVPASPAPAPADPRAAARMVAPAPPAAPPEPEREVVTAPEVYQEPTAGLHWATQTVLDDQSQAAQRPFSRNLAASDAVTTNALVLPGFPQSGSLTAPLSSTGEILVTGTIDLPRSLGISGMDRSRYDQADVDFADGFDREDAAPDTAPVRAIRAISTHTSSQGIISAKRPKGNNLPVILSITA